VQSGANATVIATCDSAQANKQRLCIRIRVHARILLGVRQVLDKLAASRRDEALALQVGLERKIGAQDIFEQRVNKVAQRRSIGAVGDFPHACQDRSVVDRVLGELRITSLPHRTLFIGKMLRQRRDDILQVLSRGCSGFDAIDDLDEVLMFLVDLDEADQQ
jgi:hypothetical protein